MLRLCALILTASLLTDISAAAPATLVTGITHSASEGNVFQSDFSDKKVGSTSQNYNLTSKTLARHWTLGLNTNVAKNDYSNFIVRDKRGQEKNLGQDFSKFEIDSILTTSFQKGSHSTNISLGSSLTESPFAYRSALVNYSFGLYHSSTVFSFDFAHSEVNQPDSYYIDREFNNKKRPEQLVSQKIKIGWQQLWSFWLKTKVELFRGERAADRPDHYGFELKQAFAPYDRFFIKNQFGFLEENKSTKLLNDRGRFNVKWIETQFDYQPNYDLTLSMVVGTSVEIESELPQSNIRRQVGTDSAGLGVSYNGSDWILNSKILSQQTNTGLKQQLLQGDVIWTL